MLAVPYRDELTARTRRGLFAWLLVMTIAVGLNAAAGRLDDLNLAPRDGALIVAATLVVAVVYSLLPPRISKQLERLSPLDPGAEHVPPERPRWRWLWIVAGGLALGGVALVLDTEVDVLALGVAIGLGGVVGEYAIDALVVRRYEREHGGTVYRLEDPPGTEAGLGWLARRGE